MANYGPDTPLQLVHFSSLYKGSLTQSAEREAVVFDIWEVKGGTIPLCFGNCDQKKPLTTFFFSATLFPQASHQDMANPLPVVAQEDLESFTLTRTGSGFALKAFHISWNTPISVKLLTSQDTTDRYGSYLSNQPHRWAAQTCTGGTRTNGGKSRIT